MDCVEACLDGLIVLWLKVELNAVLEKHIELPVSIPLFEVQLSNRGGQLVLEPSRQQLQGKPLCS